MIRQVSLKKQEPFSLMKVFIALYLLFLFALSFPAQPLKQQREGVPHSYQKPLTIEVRLACQKAIEEIYFSHRIWPKENPQPKPTFESIMADEALLAKVEDYLRKSSALEYYLQRPISGEQLQAEMERIAKNTKAPAVLEEIFNSLNNDPYLIAECLARPALVDRLVQNWYGFDERFHGELRKKAEADLQNFSEVSQMRMMSGSYSETEYVLSNLSKEEEGSYAKEDIKIRNGQVLLSEEEWSQLKNKIMSIWGHITHFSSPLPPLPRCVT